MRSPEQQAVLERLRHHRDELAATTIQGLQDRQQGRVVLVVWRKGYHDRHHHADPRCGLIDGPLAEIPEAWAKRRGNDPCPRCSK